MKQPEAPIVAWIGLDWADQEHYICLQAEGCKGVQSIISFLFVPPLQGSYLRLPCSQGYALGYFLAPLIVTERVPKARFPQQ